MSTSIATTARAVLLIVAGVGASSTASATNLITVGTGPGCTHETLSQALDAARLLPGPDEIRLTETVAYTNVAAQFADLDVSITGGYATCTSPTPRDLTTLDGFGGTTRSVLEIRGGGVVRLSRLNIIRGDEDDDSNGGGIDYAGNGVLELDNMSIQNNQAGYGGGIYFKGTGAGATLVMGDITILQNNTARHNGGGLHVSGRATLVMSAQNNLVQDNRALGVPLGNSWEDGLGGGLYLKGPARADIGSGGIFGTGIVFFDNAARLGGGIAAVGGDDSSHDSILRLYSAHAGIAQRIVANDAWQKGGGVYARTTAPGLGSSGLPIVCLFDTSLEENGAPRGAAVQLDSMDSTFAAGPIIGINRIDVCNRPADAAPCTVGRACTIISGNVAREIDGTPTDGAIIEIEENPWGIGFSGFIARDNEGGSLLRLHDGQSQSPELANCVVWRNRFSRYVAETEEERISVHHCTISGNEIGEPYVFKMDASNDEARAATITNTIIDQPAEIAVRLDGDVSRFSAAHVFTNAPFFGVPAQQLRFVSEELPGFVDPVAGDFRLVPGARAIDFAPVYNDGLVTDLFGAPRSVDRPETNTSGMRDAGALETQR